MLMNTKNDLLEKLPPGRILAVDYGTRRIGLAMSDPSQFLASSLETIYNRGVNDFVQKIIPILKENAVIAVVIGMPYNMKGDIGERGKEVQEFSSSIRKGIDIPVLTWDERLSTVSAEKTMIATNKSPSKHRHKIDQVAAAFILQSFLDRLSYLRRNGKDVK
ncbi:MAG: Holliday junction resolvase RuvX [Calditrichaeota bacterium]|nr:Holliday junction resolvase RuvX [Calditrichota bacterium]